MSQDSQDQGVIQVLLERFTKRGLPRALQMKEMVDKGGKLEPFEVNYLTEMLEDAQHLKSLIDRHPEYEELVLKAFALYTEIVKKATDNESR